MAYFTLIKLTGVQGAIDTLTALQGAYQAVDILKGALRDVKEPDDFDDEVQAAEAKVGRSYQAPAETDHAVLKAAKTAARLEGENQGVLLQLLSLVIVRLGAAQGARVVALLMAASGMDPTLALVVIKLCILLAGTEKGRKIVTSAEPQLREMVHQCANPSQLVTPLQQLAGRLGDRGNQMLAAIKDSSHDLTGRVMSKGAETLDGLLDGLSPCDPPDEQ